MSQGWIILAVLTGTAILCMLELRSRRKGKREWEKLKHEAGALNRQLMREYVLEAWPNAENLTVDNPPHELDLQYQPYLVAAGFEVDGKQFYIMVHNSVEHIVAAVHYRKVRHDKERLMHWIPKV